MASLLTRRAAAFTIFAAPLGLSGCARTEREGKERIAPEKKGADPLPSWNNGASKRAILDFTRAVVSEGPDFVEPSERIATFDNDGTLWAEQPIYTEFAFTIDRARQMLAENPALARRAPFNALAAAKEAPFSLSKDEAVALLAATHSGMTQDEFERIVNGWLATARHPRFHRPYTQCVYQPMLEVLALLRANGFKTFIVSGGGVDFMRAFVERTYGVPPEQVIGSSGQGKYELRRGVGVVIKEPRLGSIDDKAGKPQNIALHIGRRPIAAFGNSDGDQQMLEYASTGAGRRLALLVHHDDAQREYAYDRDSRIGRLSSALDEARTRGWTVVSMRHDWRTIFPAQRHSSVDPRDAPAMGRSLRGIP